ncbi:protein S100-P-like isoform X1 [Solea solea]|uniref:protein S100-P-like isoform X1 n=1 Tax=Solea solea TaxID=90069 RepID=UPI00272DA7E3|nr:protein S100-P-like isoform X1 [Solea solea]
MTTLETAMEMLVKVFETYAKADGDKDTLTKAELKNLLEKELPCLCKRPKSVQSAEKIEDKMSKLMDLNGDKLVNFQEFLVFVATVTCLSRETK